MDWLCPLFLMFLVPGGDMVLGQRAGGWVWGLRRGGRTALGQAADGEALPSSGTACCAKEEVGEHIFSENSLI